MNIHSHIFHSGTRSDGDKVLTTGGRVFAVTSFGNNIEEAVNQSFKNAENLRANTF